jgi:hypothetical protein
MCICMFCRSLCVLLAIALYVLLRFTDCDYHFGIFKLFFCLPLVILLCFRNTLWILNECLTFVLLMEILFLRINFIYGCSGRRGRDRMVLCNRCLSPLKLWVRILLRRGVLDIAFCEQACQWLTTGRWFYSGTVVSLTNKTDVITEILLKVAINTININLSLIRGFYLGSPVFMYNEQKNKHIWTYVCIWQLYWFTLKFNPFWISSNISSPYF